MNRINRGLVVGIFSLLVFMACNAPAAYADIANGTYHLQLWNNNASGGEVLVILSGSGVTRALTLTFGCTTSTGCADPRASIDKFFWNGSATLTYLSGTSGAGVAETVGWSQTPRTGFNVTNFGPFDDQTTTNNNGSPYYTTIFRVSGTFDNSCFAAHVNRPDSNTNAFVEDSAGDCVPAAAPEPASLLLLGPGLLFLGFARRRMFGARS